MSLRLAIGVVVVVVGSLLNACSIRYASLERISAVNTGSVAPATGVSVVRNGAAVAVSPDLALERGDIVQTDAQSTAVIRFAGGSATLAPNTKVTISSIWTWFGEVFFSGNVDNDTDYVGMSVDGTEYLTKVDQDTGQVTLTVLEGRVTARSKSQAFSPMPVAAWQRLTFKPGGEAPSIDRISEQEYNDIVRWVNAAQASLDKLVPSVTGLDEQTAKDRLRAVGFSASELEVKRVPAPDDALGKVASQRPGPGARGVRVVLSIGAQSLQVPELRRMTVQQASEVLPTGLVLGAQQFEAASSDALGRILRQDPEAGQSVVAGTRINLVIGALIMPDLVGRSINEVIPVLEQLGVDPQIERRPARNRAADSVLEQRPKAGTKLEPNTAVQLIIAATPATPTDPRPSADPDGAGGVPPGAVQPDVNQPDVKMCTVPDVSREQDRTWEALLKRAGFVPNTVIKPSQGGYLIVESVDPQPGSSVPCGSTVTVTAIYVVG